MSDRIDIFIINFSDGPKSDAGCNLKAVSVSTQTRTQQFSIYNFIQDQEAFHFYTGLENYETFQLVLAVLGPSVYELNYYNGMRPSIDIQDQFFLTLIRLRQYKTTFELGRFFNMSESAVTNVFITWVNLLYFTFNDLNWWPEREIVDYFLPSDFKVKFPKTRVILDGTECPVVKPKQPLAQQASFSTYKNRNTVKVLVGSTPGGLISYVSPAYGGSASDRQLIERSNIPAACDPGDSVMADKGFDVDDLFIPFKVSVNIPSFFKKQNRISSDTVIRDSKIASKRVHIERIIGLGKTFKILKNPLNTFEASLATQILTDCFYLCNFRACIVSNDA